MWDAEDPIGVPGHPVHIVAGFPGNLLGSCQVWQALIVRIRAGNGASIRAL